MALSAANGVKTFVMPVVVASLTAGCASTVEHRPLSREEFERTDFPAIVPERWWGDEAPVNLEEYVRSQAPLLRKRFPEAVDATPESAPWDSALVALFAFLGPDYDRPLGRACSSTTRDEVYRSNGLAGAFFGSALSDTTTLKELVASYVTPDIAEARMI